MDMLVYVLNLYLNFSLIHTITSKALLVADWCKNTTHWRFLFSFGQKIYLSINDLKVLELTENDHSFFYALYKRIICLFINQKY